MTASSPRIINPTLKYFNINMIDKPRSLASTLKVNPSLITLSFSAQKLLLQHSGLFFAPLALVVVNDDSVRCKKMAAMAIKTLLTQLDLNNQNTLFSLVNTWLNAEKVHIHSFVILTRKFIVFFFYICNMFVCFTVLVATNHSE